MSLKSKRGITVTSIMVYVLLFFAFTTIATVISSRFNKNLFNDRGNAINVTAINKLEYNLIDSASNSYNVDVVANGNNRTLTFSNSDVYVFDNNVIYKNGGKLVKFVKESKVKIQEDVIAIDLTLNKYTNEVSRSIKVKCSSKINSTSYLSEGLVAQYDGIKNTNLGHDNSSLVWQDISGSNVQAEFNDYVKNNGVENYWKDDGIYFTKQKDTSDYQRVGGTTTYAGNIYSAMTFEITMTNLSDLGTGGTDYMYPLYIRQTDGSAILFFGIRKNVSLMYRSGHNTVFNNTKINVLKNHKYTFTFVQENLTTRALYINGALIQRTTGLALDSIIFGQILMQSHQNGSYIINSLRVYDRALSANEVLQNYNVDVLRFGN